MHMHLRYPYQTLHAAECFCRWRKLSSSCLNEAAEDDAMGRDTGKSYTPQYSVTGQQVNYRVEKGEQLVATRV